MTANFENNIPKDELLKQLGLVGEPIRNSYEQLINDNTISEQFSVTFKGFKTKEEAKQFATWYSIQGEQQIDYWLDCRREEGIVDCVSMTASNINDDTNNIIVDLTVS